MSRPAYIPDVWDNDAEMKSLMSLPKARHLNPTNHKRVMEFWKDLIAEYCKHEKTCLFSLDELKQKFRRGSQLPSPLAAVIQEMQESGAIKRREEYKKIGQSWIERGASLLQPAAWLGFGSQASNSKTEKMVHLPTLKTQAKELLLFYRDEYENVDCPEVVDYAELKQGSKNIMASESFEFVIDELVKQGEVSVGRSKDGDKVLKFKDQSSKGPIRFTDNYTSVRELRRSMVKLEVKPRKVAKEMDIPIISLDELKSAWKKSTAGDVDVCKELFAHSEINNHSAPLDPFSNMEEPIIDEQVPVNDAHELEQPSTSIYAEFSKLVSEPVESLSKMSFRLQFFDDKELQDATNLVTPLKGKIVTSDSEFADITLTPLLIKPSADMSVIGSSTVCSIFWLRKCIAEGIVFDPKSDPLYIPFLIKDGYSDIFKGCVVALSGLSALERNTVQNNITRKRRENLVPNTHVVVTKENTKSTTARQWNIFALNYSWIIECVSKQQRCAEEDAQFDARSNETYTRSDDIWNYDAKRTSWNVHPDESDLILKISSDNLDSIMQMSSTNMHASADVASVFCEPLDFDQLPNRDTALDSVRNNHSGEMAMTSRNFIFHVSTDRNPAQTPSRKSIEVRSAPVSEIGRKGRFYGREAVSSEKNSFADDVVKQMNKNIQELPSQQDSDSFSERKIRHALKVAVAKSAGHILGNNITDSILTQEDCWLEKPASPPRPHFDKTPTCGYFEEDGWLEKASSRARSQPPSTIRTATHHNAMNRIRSNTPVRRRKERTSRKPRR
ncbi:charged multivesicular body protein 7 [Ditylenchus destructor]|nr:charged multivesicular body protein 7 [Ditylenchus destructor]